MIVLCIDDSISAEQMAFVMAHVPNWPRKGKKYTIRQICHNDGIVDGYLLEELVSPPAPCVIAGQQFFIETRFATWRFVETSDEVIEEVVEESIEQTA